MRLGNTDLEITPIGLGCMQFAGRGMIEHVYPSVPQDTVRDIVRTALAGGISWFDTAEMYGRGESERALTTALHSLDVSPGDVVIATKWLPFLRSAVSIERTVDNRIAALQGYPIDLYQIHLPYGSFSSLGTQLDAMARLAKAHKIRWVGVSNFSARQLDLAARRLRTHGLVLASNQVEISLLRRDIERNGVLDTACRLGVTLIAYSPLASGVLTGVFHDDPARVRTLPMARRFGGRYTDKALARAAPLIEELRAIGVAYGVSPAQVALNWLVHYYRDTVVAIPGASKPKQAAESAGALGFRLTERELAVLEEKSRS